jgi:acyl carrier protein
LGGDWVAQGRGEALTAYGKNRIRRKIMGLDAAEIIMEAEEYFDIKMSDEKLEKTDTVSKFIDLVWSHVQEGSESTHDVSEGKLSPQIPRKNWSKNEVREIVRKIISDKLDIKVFSGEARFVDDLGLD